MLELLACVGKAWGIENPQLSSSEGAVDRALSTSFIAALAHNEQRRVAEQIRSVVAGLGDEFDYPLSLRDAGLAEAIGTT